MIKIPKIKLYLVAALVMFLQIIFVVENIALGELGNEWQFIDVSGSVVDEVQANKDGSGRAHRKNIDKHYHYIKFYNYGLDHSDERFRGKYSAQIAYDLSGLQEFVEQLKAGEFDYRTYSDALSNTVPAIKKSALVQSIDAEPYKAKVVHVSFFVKARPKKVSDIVYEYGFTDKFIEKLADKKNGMSAHFVRDFIRKLRHTRFEVKMEVYVHTADKIHKYLSTSEPEKGEADWQRFTSLIAVPKSATAITVGFSISGIGEVWADDFVLIPKSDYNKSQASQYREFDKQQLAEPDPKNWKSKAFLNAKDRLTNKIVLQENAKRSVFDNGDFESH